MVVLLDACLTDRIYSMGGSLHSSHSLAISQNIHTFAIMNTLLDFKKIEKISKALGDPYRLKIIEAIRKEPEWMQCGCIVNMLHLSQSAISHHIKQLVDAEL